MGGVLRGGCLENKKTAGLAGSFLLNIIVHAKKIQRFKLTCLSRSLKLKILHYF